MIVYGFTGTQRGMTDAQKRRVASFLSAECKVRHGDCIGADEEFHKLARAAHRAICIHPPIDPKKRAFCESLYVKPPRPYLDRNKDIVNSCTVLLACPGEAEEQLRSGTWSTVRYARKQKHPVLVIDPEGFVGV